MSRGLATRLFLTIWLVYLVHFNPTHPGANRFVYLMEAVAEHREVRLDRVDTFYEGDILEFRGHRYSNTNPGLAFVASPFWAISRWAIAESGGRGLLENPVTSFFIAHFVATATVTAPLTAFSALILAGLVRRRTGSGRRGVLAAVVYAFGTIAFHFSTHFNQNVAIAALSLAAFATLFEPGMLRLREGRGQAALIGLLVGVGVVVDLSVVPFAAVLATASVRRWRGTPARLFWAAGGAMAPMAMLAAYLWTAFGDPFAPPQAYYPIAGATGLLPLMTSFSLNRLAGNLILPGRGLVPFMPFTALALLYLPGRYWKQMSERSLERFTVASVVVVYFAYVWANASADFSQFGPRYLIPAIPFLVLVFAIAVPREHAAIATVLVAASLLINWIGAMLGYGTTNVFKSLGVLLTHGLWLPVVDWFAAAEVRSVTGLPHLRNASGPFIFLFFLLAGIWTSWVIGRWPTGTRTSK